MVSPLVAVLVGAAVGYAIVALRLKHGFFWFTLLFAGSIFPLQMLLVPLFVGYADTNLYDTRLGMLIVYTAISVPFASFVMRNFFTGVSYSLFEAAVMDGARPTAHLPQHLPAARQSALAAIFILQATFVWNDLLLGLTLSQADDVRPIMPALTSLQSTYGGSALPTVLAGALLVSLPTWCCSSRPSGCSSAASRSASSDARRRRPAQRRSRGRAAPGARVRRRHGARPRDGHAVAVPHPLGGTRAGRGRVGRPVTLAVRIPRRLAGAVPERGAGARGRRRHAGLPRRGGAGAVAGARPVADVA